MVEYGNGVGQAGQVAGSAGHASSAGPTDLGASVAAGFTDALNHASAAVGVPPALLLVAALVVLLFGLYLVFAR